MLPPLSLFTERAQRTLLIFSQVYVPDPASLGQHMHDVASEMVRRGQRVVVLSADRGYEDPTRSYARYEQLDGVHIVRLPWSSFGKGSVATRLVGGGIFLSEATSLALTLQRIDHVLVSTSPPFCGLGGLAISLARNVPLTFWAMDLNPDQIVAVGALSADALPVRALDWLNRLVLARARRVIALDRFMAQRLEGKRALGAKVAIIPPWPQIEVPEPTRHGETNAFRERHDLRDAVVVMYSGNLSPVHPITTLLDAAEVLRDHERLRFVFVGGGTGRAEIERVKEARRLRNVITLPYQPLAALAESLSAADVHLVSIGDAMVGIVHPCKVYGAMAVGRPILSLGPAQSHVAELVRTEHVGWHVQHGDLAAMLDALRELAAMEDRQLDEMGSRASRAIAQRFSRTALLAQFCDVLDARASGPARVTSR